MRGRWRGRRGRRGPRRRRYRQRRPSKPKLLATAAATFRADYLAGLKQEQYGQASPSEIAGLHVKCSRAGAMVTWVAHFGASACTPAPGSTQPGGEWEERWTVVGGKLSSSSVDGPEPVNARCS